MSTIQELPRAAVRTYVETWLQAVRLPLTAVELVAGKRGEDAWPPALAFETFEAKVKQQVGGFTGDQQLVDQAGLITAKVDQRRKAEELEAEAERRRAEAEASYQQSKDALEEKEERARRELQAREAEAERKVQAKKREARQEVAKHEEQAEQAERVVERAVEANERKAKRAAITAEEQALRQRQGAEEAVAEVLELDTAIESNRAARRAAK